MAESTAEITPSPAPNAVETEPSAAPVPPGKDRITLGLLALIVVLGLALRFWGIGWSLPDARHPLTSYHPDELVDNVAAQQVDIAHGNFDTKFYSYGAFYFYLVNLAQTIGYGYGAIPNTPPQPAGSPPLSKMTEWERRVPETAKQFLAGRIVTALMGALTIPVLFALGARLFDRRVGLISALLYAILPLAVVHAHFLTVDVPATLFVTLALLWSARLLSGATLRDYVLAGVWTGLAAATKYNAGLVIIAPITAHFLSAGEGKREEGRGNGVSQGAGPRGKRTPEPRNSRHLPLAALIGATALAFLIGCPGPLLNWNAFWNGTYPDSGVRYELLVHPRTGHGLLFVNTGPGWWYHLVISLRYGLGLPLLLLVITGLATAFQVRSKQDRLLLTFFLCFYLLAGFSAVRFARYMMPLFPVCCVLAARRLTEAPARRIGQHTVHLTLALVVVLTGGYTVSLVHAMAVTDPRDAAANYLERDAPQKATVAFAKIPWYFSPPLSPWFGALNPLDRAKAARETTRFTLRIPESEWDVSVLTPTPDYLVLSNIETTNEIRLKIPRTKQFLQAIPATDQRIEFAPAPIFDMASPWSTGPASLTHSTAAEGTGDRIIPDDLLYILPHLTIYKKPGL